MHGFGHGFGDACARRQIAAEQQVADDLHEAGFGVGLVFADHPHDHAVLFGTAAKDRRFRILAVEVVQNRDGLEHHVIAIAQDRQTATRVHRQHLRRLMLLLVELEHVTVVSQSLVFKGQQHPPAVAAVVAPIKIDGH